MNRNRTNGKQNDSENTLLAINQFTTFLHDMEENVSQESKKLRNKETAQSAGFVAAGIHEALSYLAIVKKVIQKTQRALRKQETQNTGTPDLANPI